MDEKRMLINVERIPYGTGIFTYIWLTFIVNVRKYSELMGICYDLPFVEHKRS